jgi:hypothetical protein
VTYIQFLWLRRWLLIYTCAVVVIALSGASAYTWSARPPNLPLYLLLLGSGFATFIATITIGSSLNRANEGRDLLWTLPFSRVAIASRYVALDIAFILAAFIETVVIFGIVPVVKWHLPGSANAYYTWLALFTAIGANLMWYAWLQLATAGTTLKGGMIAGLFWAALVLARVPLYVRWIPGLHNAAMVLNVMNPLSYLVMGKFQAVGFGRHIALFPNEPSLRAVLPWLFTALALPLAVSIWRRAEA